MFRLIVRFIISALVLLLLSFILPGFAVEGFVGALLAAVVITILGYFVEGIMGKKISPRNRGIVGFIVSAIVIYVSQVFVTALTVTFLGAALAAIVFRFVDAFVPKELC